MVRAAHVPHHFPTLPKSIPFSFQIKDELKEQREEAWEILKDTYKIYDSYFTKQKHSLITPEMAKKVIGQTDQTTLREERNESPDWMVRMAWEATKPFPMRSVCTWPDIEKILPLIENLRDHPAVGITVVLNYPHGDMNPKSIIKEIEKWRNFYNSYSVKNPLDIDTVIPYHQWIDGNEAHVKAVLDAEGKAGRDNGFTWKSIQMVSAQARFNDFFGQVYRSTMMALESGADFAKTSTGLAAAPPHNDFVTKDTGPLIKAIPMLMALRDFNAEYGTRRVPKFSGGNENEADAAVLREGVARTLGSDFLDEIAFGTSPKFRLRLLQFIHEELGDKCGFDPKEVFKPYGIDMNSIPEINRGIPDPRIIKQNDGLNHTIKSHYGL